jgi:hypothetical protein
LRHGLNLYRKYTIKESKIKPLHAIPRHSLCNGAETSNLYLFYQLKEKEAGLMTTLHLPLVFHHPNFSAFREGGFALNVENGRTSKEDLRLVPLRPQSKRGGEFPLWELRCRKTSGFLAGGCALSLSLAGGDFPSPREIPHPVLGEWLIALRYTGLNWLECGPISVAPGFSEEGVANALWEGLSRLMRRNDASFLVGTAPVNSLFLDMAVRRGARVLEHYVPGSSRYFLYAE